MNHSGLIRMNKEDEIYLCYFYFHFRFATSTIMWHYGVLLQNFCENSSEVNDCIFTMMYHVAGDCQKPNMLLHLPILKSFSKIWDCQYPLSDVSIHVFVAFVSLQKHMSTSWCSCKSKKPIIRAFKVILGCIADVSMPVAHNK